MTAAIVQFQKKEEAKFICSSCGADRGCKCNAPAIEKLAEKIEQDRKRSKAYRERKSKEKQQSHHVTDEEFTVEDGLETDEYREAFLLRAADALSFAVYSGPVDISIIEAAGRVAMKWEELVETLEAINAKTS